MPGWEVVTHLMEPGFAPELCETCDWWMLNTAEKVEHDSKPCEAPATEGSDATPIYLDEAEWRAAEVDRRGSPECGCAAFDLMQGWHAESDHKGDCGSNGGDPPCGGCWECQAGQASHRAYLDSVAAPGQEGRS